MPPSGVNESCMPLTAPQLASVVVVAKSAVDAIPKRTSLPSMLPPGCMALVCWSTPCNKRIAASLHRVRDGDAGETQNRHCRPDGPAVLLGARHAAERVGEARAEREHHHDLHEIGERSGILERVGAVCVEEATAVRAEDLDRFLRGDRSLRDHLIGYSLRGGLAVRNPSYGPFGDSGASPCRKAASSEPCLAIRTPARSQGTRAAEPTACSA